MPAAAEFGKVLETRKRDLPPRLHLKDGGYYYVHRNKWTYVADTRAAAMRRYISELADSETLRRAAAMLMNDPKAMAKYMTEVYWRAKKNARIRKIAFRISLAEYRAIVTRANGSCEVTGLPFDLQLRPNSFRRPYSPSLDRIDSALPYTPENCRLVCCLANAAMSDWGSEPFSVVAAALARKNGWVHPDE